MLEMFVLKSPEPKKGLENSFCCAGMYVAVINFWLLFLQLTLCGTRASKITTGPILSKYSQNPRRKFIFSVKDQCPFWPKP